MAIGMNNWSYDDISIDESYPVSIPGARCKIPINPGVWGPPYKDV